MGFDVRVVDESGDGVDGARVTLGFKTSVRGMTTPEYTGSDGHAEFEGYDDGEVKVFVDGADCGTYDYKDGESITITR
jgi:hypothetical protein